MFEMGCQLQTGCSPRCSSRSWRGAGSMLPCMESCGCSRTVAAQNRSLRSPTPKPGPLFHDGRDPSTRSPTSAGRSAQYCCRSPTPTASLHARLWDTGVLVVPGGLLTCWGCIYRMPSLVELLRKEPDPFDHCRRRRLAIAAARQQVAFRWNCLQRGQVGVLDALSIARACDITHCQDWRSAAPQASCSRCRSCSS